MGSPAVHVVRADQLRKKRETPSLLSVVVEAYHRFF